MSKQLIKCKECGEWFEWCEKIIKVENDYYHRNCVEIYPSKYVAFIDSDFIGEVENEDGDVALELLSEGEYIDE